MKRNANPAAPKAPRPRTPDTIRIKPATTPPDPTRRDKLVRALADLVLVAVLAGGAA